MTSEIKKYITTKEVADLLNVSAQTIYRYVKEGKLTPLFDHKWRMTKTKIFSPEDVEQLRISLEKPGLTTTEAAEKLGVQPSTINKYIKENVLKADKKLYRGRSIYFLDEEHFNSFAEHYNRKKSEKSNRDFYSKETGFYLFQSFVTEGSPHKARIMKLDDHNIELNIEIGGNTTTFSLEESQKEGYKPVEQFQEKPYSTKKGEVVFEFSKPKTINSPIYEVIELLYRQVGWKNIRINENSFMIKVKVKPCTLEASKDYLDLLQTHIIEGEIFESIDGIILDSPVSPVTIFVTKEEKEHIKRKAEEQGLTQEEYVTKIVKMGIKEETDEVKK